MTAERAACLPAALVRRVGAELPELALDLHANDVGREHRPRRCALSLAHGEDRRQHRRARAPAHGVADVVEVQRVGGGSVGEGGELRRCRRALRPEPAGAGLARRGPPCARRTARSSSRPTRGRRPARRRACRGSPGGPAAPAGDATSGSLSTAKRATASVLPDTAPTSTRLVQGLACPGPDDIVPLPAFDVMTAAPRRTVTRPGNDSERRRPTRSGDVQPGALPSTCSVRGQYTCGFVLATSSAICCLAPAGWPSVWSGRPRRRRGSGATFPYDEGALLDAAYSCRDACARFPHQRDRGGFQAWPRWTLQAPRHALLRRARDRGASGACRPSERSGQPGFDRRLNVSSSVMTR